MVDPSLLALTTTPAMTGSAAEPTLPVRATPDCACTGSAKPSWNRTAVEASNAPRIRMAFSSDLERAEFGTLTKPRPAGTLLQGGCDAHTRTHRKQHRPMRQSSGSTRTISAE